MRFVRNIYHQFKNDSLYKNSIILMLGTVVMAFFGFFFWMINARLFTTEQIGLATTLISVSAMIASFSMLGLDIGLIRYIPRSERRNDQINTSFLVSSVSTLIAITLFLVGLNRFSPRLLFVRENIVYLTIFVIFMLFNTANNLLDNIFIAFRDTRFVLIKNTVFSMLKLILPFFLVGFGVFGIFGSWAMALIVSFIIIYFVLIIKFGYVPKIIIDKGILTDIGKYSFGNYIAGFFYNLPTMVLPLMITNLINPETTAYYYMAIMIVGIIFIIPGATTASLLAEGSYDEKEMKEHMRKAVKIISLILIPAILAILLFGKYILLAFGKEYSSEGLVFLKILAISSILVSINQVYRTAFRIKHAIKKIIVIDLLGALLIMGLSYMLISKGLLGIGLAWISGLAITSLVYLISWKLLYVDVSIKTPRS